MRIVIAPYALAVALLTGPHEARAASDFRPTTVPAASPADSASPAATIQTTQPAGARSVSRDLPYAGPGAHERQTLDLYLPHVDAGAKPVPVVVWIHGGRWNAGDKSRPPAERLLERGFAVASINYRYASQAIFPAQVHDAKAAVRFLRGNAARYGIDPDRVAAWGASAGGQLALLLGVGAGVAELEGTLGQHLEQPSGVRCVVDSFGTVEFRDPRAFPLNDNRLRLLGGNPDDDPAVAARAALATPLTHVTPDDAPVLILHGDADRTVTISHSHALHKALRAAGVEVRMVVIPGAGHGGEKFQTPEIDRAVDEFLDAHLRR
jgi:acetyl esterase/lipase